MTEQEEYEKSARNLSDITILIIRNFIDVRAIPAAHAMAKVYKGLITQSHKLTLKIAKNDMITFNKQIDIFSEQMKAECTDAIKSYVYELQEHHILEAMYKFMDELIQQVVDFLREYSEDEFCYAYARINGTVSDEIHSVMTFEGHSNIVKIVKEDRIFASILK